MPSTRDPYPYPRYENENTFRGTQSKRVNYTKPTHLAQQEDPWNRLHDTPTLSSDRRAVYHNDPEAPSDSLDFTLKTLYDHHDGLLKDRNETLYQPETFTENHGRILKNRVPAPPVVKEEKPSIRQWVSPQRISIDSTDGAIVSHHTAATNRGYSRKQDGGYYSI
ncbi:cilia- and flagella-associated protein 276 [Rhinophrynus dorsalis]